MSGTNNSKYTSEQDRWETFEKALFGNPSYDEPAVVETEKFEFQDELVAAHRDHRDAPPNHKDGHYDEGGHDPEPGEPHKDIHYDDGETHVDESHHDDHTHRDS